MHSQKFSDEEFDRRLAALVEIVGDDDTLVTLEKMVKERRSADIVSAWIGKKRVLIAWLLAGLAAGMAGVWGALGPLAEDVKGWFFR